MKKAALPAMALLGLGLAAPGWGGHLVSLESTYLGGGLFEYRLKIAANSGRRAAPLFGIAEWSVPFVEPIDWTTPSDWDIQASLGGQVLGWTWNPPAGRSAVTLPYERVFRAQSGQLGYRRDPGDWLTVMVVSNAVGVVRAGPVLVPCPEEEGDNSSTNLVSYFLTHPDLRLDRLVVTNGQPREIWASATNTANVELQASRDLTQWAGVANLRFVPPVTVWSLSPAVETAGNFYRLRLLNWAGVVSVRTE